MANLKVVSLNVEGDKHLSTILPFLKKENPDVICLQEVVEKDVPIFTSELHMQGKYVPCIYINEENRAGMPIGETVGLLMLTSLPIHTITTHYYEGNNDEKLRNFGNIEPNAFFRMLLMLEAKKENTDFRIITTHFTWTPDGNSSELQKEHLARMRQQLLAYESFVLCGDFNAPRGGEIWSILSSWYTDSIPPDVSSTLDPVIHRVPDLSFVVDGMFHTPGYKVTDVRIVSGVSDHQAIVATLHKS